MLIKRYVQTNHWSCLQKATTWPVPESQKDIQQHVRTRAQLWFRRLAQVQDWSFHRSLLLYPLRSFGRCHHDQFCRWLSQLVKDVRDEITWRHEQHLTCYICPSGYPTDERRITWRSKFGREIIQPPARPKCFSFKTGEIAGRNATHGMEEVNSAIDKATHKIKTLGTIQPIVNPRCPATNRKSTFSPVFIKTYRQSTKIQMSQIHLRTHSA